MGHVTDTPLPAPVLPDVLVEAFRQLLAQSDQNQWDQGDFICDVITEFRVLEKNEEYIRTLRSSIIRQLADRTGADRSTLRDRHLMSQFYPPRIRADYIPPLTYHQLRACKSAGAQHWQEYADWAVDNLPAPVAVIRSRIKHNGHQVPAWIARWEAIKELAYLVAFDNEAQPIIRGLCRVLTYW